jgi:hypothetical protein
MTVTECMRGELIIVLTDERTVTVKQNDIL